AVPGSSEGTTGAPSGFAAPITAVPELRPNDAVPSVAGVASRAVVVSSMGASRDRADAWTIVLRPPADGCVPRGAGTTFTRSSPGVVRRSRCLQVCHRSQASPGRQAECPALAPAPIAHAPSAIAHAPTPIAHGPTPLAHAPAPLAQVPKRLSRRQKSRRA